MNRLFWIGKSQSFCWFSFNKYHTVCVINIAGIFISIDRPNNKLESK
jgi:hypothetical protein